MAERISPSLAQYLAVWCARYHPDWKLHVRMHTSRRLAMEFLMDPLFYRVSLGGGVGGANTSVVAATVVKVVGGEGRHSLEAGMLVRALVRAGALRRAGAVSGIMLTGVLGVLAGRSVMLRRTAAAVAVKEAVREAVEDLDARHSTAKVHGAFALGEKQ